MPSFEEGSFLFSGGYMFLDNIRRTLFEALWEDGPNGLYLLMNGLRETAVITVVAIFFGIVIGVFISLLRMSRNRLLSGLARGYTEIIRGTPLLVQLLIIYFVVFKAVDLNKTMAAVIAFGLNSGAYVSEIIRAGIQAVSPGQMEAARSLGMPFGLSMREIILPQAVKNILPALGNEFIVLLKETSIVGFIGGNDLMRAGNKIRSITYEATIPLFSTAIIYLVITFTLSQILARFERRLHKGD
jgi:polar amino acid transport system permease protein